MKTKKINFIFIFEYVILFAIIFNANSIYINLTLNRNNILNYFILFILICGVFGCICYTNISIKQFNKLIFYVFVTILYFLIYIFLRPNNLTGDVHLLIVSCILLFYFFFCCSKNSIPKLLSKYSSLIYALSVFSVLMWIFCSIFKIIPQTNYVYSDWTGADQPLKVSNYFYLYFETQKIDMFGFKGIIRNSAIFSEAPMASFHFSLALLIELFLKSKISKKRCVVLIIAIISTFSTTGYLLVVMALGVKILLYKPKNNSLRTIKYFCVPICFIILGAVSVRLISAKLSTSSGSIRIDDFVAGFKAWGKNPWFGNGEGEANQVILEKYMSSFRSYNTGFSNSIMRILSSRGIYGGLIYLICFCKAFWSSIKYKDINKFLFTTFFLYLFTITVIPYLYITIFILIFFANNKKTFKRIKNIEISAKVNHTGYILAN